MPEAYDAVMADKECIQHRRKDMGNGFEGNKNIMILDHPLIQHKITRLRDKSRKVLEIREVVGLEDEEIITRELWRFEEKEGSSEKVIGDFRKINDLLNVRKLKDAGLLSVYRERYMQ